MRIPIAALLACAYLTSASSAQTVVFDEGFETGLAQWTATGMWHAVAAGGACLGFASPFPEGTHAVWYGRVSTCDYDDGLANSGRLQSNTWITLPANAASVSLYFKSSQETEACWHGEDVHSYVLEFQSGLVTTGLLCYESESPVMPTAGFVPWYERRIDLTDHRGMTLRFAFQFATNNTVENGLLGWLIDDVRVVAEPGRTFCPSPVVPSACPCDAILDVGGGCRNSLYRSATLQSGGVASVALDTLSFTAAEMPPGTAATLFQGTSPVTTPIVFGDGVLCLSGSLTRLGTQFAPSGSAVWPLAGNGPISSAGGVPPPGGDRYYQVVYRDAVPGQCTSATFNQTGAQRVSWQP